MDPSAVVEVVQPSALDRVLQGGVAIGTLVLAFFTWRLARTTRDDVRASTAIAQESRKAVEETIRSRADARGPRVAVLLELPEWPPRLPANTPEHETPKAMPGQRYLVDDEPARKLLLRAQGRLVNEGRSTAVITLHGNAWFWMQAPVHSLGDGRFALLPGQAADFTFEDGLTIQEWAAAWNRRREAPNQATLFLEVIVMDQFDDGIVDNTGVHMGGYPIVPDDGGWVIRDTRHVALDQEATRVWSSVSPTRRRYFRSRAAGKELGYGDDGG